MEDPKNSHTYRQLIFDKEAKTMQWRKKKASLTNGADPTGCLLLGIGSNIWI
jgi:hypothetical protein